MAWFLALDAGGTKTDYVLADGMEEKARVRGGPVKRMRVDERTAARNLDMAIVTLTERTGVSMREITATCVGAAGHSVPLVADWLRASLSERVSGELEIVSDVEIALDAAFPGEGGIVVLAGTGSNVAGRMPDGSVATAGGWGPVLADQGSGHKIGVRALRTICAAEDEGRPTLLKQAVLDFWRLGQWNEVLAVANGAPAPDFSQLAPVVLRCAEAGDATAIEVLRREGEDLGRVVCVLIRRFQSAASAELPQVAFAGSVMEKIAPVRQALIAAVLKEFPTIQTQPGIVDPLAGALRRARAGRLQGHVVLA